MIRGIKGVEDRLKKMEQIDCSVAVGKGIEFVQGAAKRTVRKNDGVLEKSILTEVRGRPLRTEGICFTNAPHNQFIEFGTGPRGQANHKGISPNVAVSYSQSPWWIHESQIERRVAEKYKFFYIDTPEGRFYQCSGQPAKPYLYPALKNNVDEVMEIIRKEIEKQL